MAGKSGTGSASKGQRDTTKNKSGINSGNPHSGSSYNSDGQRVTSFTGVSTGRSYEVGAIYEMNGAMYRANPDGSFSNYQTGRDTVGSYYGGGKASFSVSGGAQPRPTQAFEAPRQTTQTSGPGAGQVIKGSGPPVTTGPGVPGAVAPRAPLASGLAIGTTKPRQQRPSDHPTLPKGKASGPYVKHEIPIEDEFSVRFDGPVPVADYRYVGGRPMPMMGIPFEMSPNVPSGQVIEDEFGEADITNPNSIMANTLAAIGHLDWNGGRLADYVNRTYSQPAFASIGRAVNQFNDSARDRINGGMPRQEPVDWGRQ